MLISSELSGYNDAVSISDDAVTTEYDGDHLQTCWHVSGLDVASDA